VTWWAWAGLVAFVVGLIVLIVLLSQRLGEKKAEKRIAEHDADVQKRMAEAEAGKPRDVVDLERRLRGSRF
jgi:hypothetical protein